jgi:hypothetical protein
MRRMFSRARLGQPIPEIGGVKRKPLSRTSGPWGGAGRRLRTPPQLEARNSWAMESN